jgi:hypothetical protein
MIITAVRCGPRKWQDLPEPVRAAVIEERANTAWTDADHCLVWMLQTIEKMGDPPSPDVLAYRAQAEGFEDDTIQQALESLAKLLR